MNRPTSPCRTATAFHHPRMRTVPAVAETVQRLRSPGRHQAHLPIALFGLAALVVLTLVTAVCSAADLATLERAQEAYDRGVAVRATDPSAARAAFAESADGFARAVSDGAHNAAMHFNLGNALVQSGDLGRGIASYMRGLRLAPNDRAIAANLASARADVRLRVPSGDESGFGNSMALWRAVPEVNRIGLAIGAWVLGWSIVGLSLILPSLRGDHRAAIWGRALRNVALATALLVAATVAVDWWVVAARPLGVVVADAVVLRKGNGEGFAPQLADTLSPGVEFRLLEERPGWLRIKLQDGTEGWIRGDDAVRV